MPEAGTLLAFDFGRRRIGVAVGAGAGGAGAARPLCAVEEEGNERRFAAIAALIAEWRPARLLVGRPLHEDGTPHDMTARCERFANQLRGRFGLPVDAVDERFSSLEADAALRARGHGWSARKQRVDAEAACVILQSWLEAHGRAAA